jgi:hypothetical protein
MRRWLITSALVLMGSAPAFGQLINYPYGGGQMPNIYNQQTQPLSPYLQMNRNNPAVNYYYGTRPGTGAGGYLGLNGNVGAGNNMMFMKQTFFPYVDTIATNDLEIAGPVLRATGHPVAFNNPLYYFGAGSMGMQNQNRLRQGQGNQRNPYQQGSQGGGMNYSRY